MANYITVDQLRDYMADTSNLDEANMTSAVVAASRRVDTLCGRYFSQDAAVSDKFFAPDNWWVCDLKDTSGQRWDLSTTTGLVVACDQGYNGSYAVTLNNGTDFYTEPVNGFRFGQAGWPIERLVALSNSGSVFPIPVAGFKPTVKITGRWGWAAVPDSVIQATLVEALGIYKRKSAPFGIAGQGDFGSIRVRDDPLVLELLEPYVRASRWVA
jgi:hypothetical protein